MPNTSVPGGNGWDSYGLFTTIPLKSNPGMAGYPPMEADTPAPDRVLASIGFTPAATTRTSTSLSTGEGTGTDAARSASGVPGASTTTARIVSGGSATSVSGTSGDDRSGRILIVHSF